MEIDRRTFTAGILAASSSVLLEGCSSKNDVSNFFEGIGDNEGYPSNENFKVENVFDEMCQGNDARARGINTDQTFTKMLYSMNFVYGDKYHIYGHNLIVDEKSYFVEDEYFIHEDSDNKIEKRLTVHCLDVCEDNLNIIFSYDPTEKKAKVSLSNDLREVEHKSKEVLKNSILVPYFDNNANSKYSFDDIGNINFEYIVA